MHFIIRILLFAEAGFPSFPLFLVNIDSLRSKIIAQGSPEFPG